MCVPRNNPLSASGVFRHRPEMAPVYSDGLQRLEIWTWTTTYFLSRLRGMQHFIDHPRPTSVSSRACVFFLLGCSDNVVPCPSFASQNALKSDWMYSRSHGFCISVRVICSVSLIRPSAVFSCSLMNAQRWGEAWMWLFQNFFWFLRNVMELFLFD